jgi:hypothetical protein
MMRRAQGIAPASTFRLSSDGRPLMPKNILFIKAARSGEADDGTHLNKAGTLHFPLNQDRLKHSKIIGGLHA